MTSNTLPPVLTRQDFDTDEEFELYQTSERDEWKSTGEIRERRLLWQKAARNTINQKRIRISLAIPERNLARLKSLALRKGVPYQTLINEILHQHVRRVSDD